MPHVVYCIAVCRQQGVSAEQKTQAREVTMRTLELPGIQTLLTVLRRKRVIMAIKRHSVMGGLAGGAAEALTTVGDPGSPPANGGPARQPRQEIKGQEYLRRANDGFSTGAIPTAAKRFCEPLEGESSDVH